ncbi:uncharacterized protein VTP21DRAFT_7292 [Calcarisporiella thermophila]|uniref:uncharacterized protein n=1 Tax=Calcarisporiella thermophila TaxID=911321 RepID=UPI003742CF9F
MADEKHYEPSTLELGNSKADVVSVDDARKPGPIPGAAWMIIITEFCERFAYYGASTLFQHYMIGELKIDQGTSTAINRGFIFLAYITTIFGAVVADSYLGKFRTILIFSIWYLFGMVFLTTSSIPTVDPGYHFPGFLVALYVFIAFGTGGIKSNVSSFAAEQVPTEDVVVPEKNIIYDHSLTVERIFRYFYWAINLGSAIAQLMCPTLANTKGFEYAFMVPTCIFAIGITVFVIGRSRYITPSSTGDQRNGMVTKLSVLGKFAGCVSYALTHRKPEHEHWLDGAKSEKEGSLPWDNKFVDDVRRTLNACKVFTFYPIYWALYNNMYDNFISVGLRMQRPSWLGPEQLHVINSLTLVVAIPIFDMFIFPMLRRCGFKLGPITRITIGFTITAICFVYVTVLQSFVYKSAPYFDFSMSNLPKEAVNDISVFWQIPSYLLIAISEIFASITGLEYAFRAAAPELKSVVTALFLCTNAFGSLLGMIIAVWSKDPNFVIVYGAETAVIGVFTIVFWFLFRRYNSDVE